MIGNSHDDLQPLARIITKRFYNIHNDELNSYLRDETKNANEQLASLQRDNQSKENNNKIELKLHIR